jgi:hypothetical protein
VSERTKGCVGTHKRMCRNAQKDVSEHPIGKTLRKLIHSQPPYFIVNGNIFQTGSGTLFRRVLPKKKLWL